jgi:putative oxidoreductase
MWSFIKKIVTSKYLALVFRIYIGYIFIYASLSKIQDPTSFAENIAAYAILPYWGINPVAVILPWMELVCGFLLIIGLRTRTAASILAALLFIFTVFVVINVLRGSTINCGCFDNVGEPIGWAKVAQNTLWLGMTILVYFYDRIFLFRTEGILSKKDTMFIGDET